LEKKGGLIVVKVQELGAGTSAGKPSRLPNSLE